VAFNLYSEIISPGDRILRITDSLELQYQNTLLKSNH
jgi:hypothetical protein